MKLSDFNYELPKRLIAQQPLKERADCRLMVIDRQANLFRHTTFSSILDSLMPGDALVINDTKVIPARLFGKRKTGGSVEIFLLETKDPISEALVRPSMRLKDGESITLENGDIVKLGARGHVGRFVEFARPVREILAEAGHMPLPPYIDRADEISDRVDYQTVYGAREGATASPTAGLHFTQELLAQVKAKGVNILTVTLHTNYGTFASIKTDEIESHKMHKEYFELPSSTARAIAKIKKSGGKVMAVGTTATRVLEHCAGFIMQEDVAPDSAPYSGYTNLFIYPGFEFKIVDRLITNFHLPKSTLLLLVSAFAGREILLRAYNLAIRESYRFFSYGDAMLIV